MIQNLYKRFISNDFIGLGLKVSTQAGRFIGTNGEFNVRKTGLPLFERLSFYHTLISMSWPQFIALVLAAYLIMNCTFAVLYFIGGFESLAGDETHTVNGRFIDAFFFSAQTLTTVGYGRISPLNMYGNIVASIEALIGLMSFALATGLIYGRFSRPLQKIKFSDKALIVPFRGGRAFMFRIANAKHNLLTEVTGQIMMAIVLKENGEPVRKYYDMPLDHGRVNFLALHWTVVHVIDEQSPLYSLTAVDLEEGDVEFMIVVNGYDDGYGQSMHSYYSYKHDEVEWGAKFVPMYRRSDDGRATILEMEKLSAYEKAELPPVQAAG